MTLGRRYPPPRPGRRPPNYRPALTIFLLTLLAGGAVVLFRPPRDGAGPSPTPTVVVTSSPSASSSPSPSPSPTAT